MISLIGISVIAVVYFVYRRRQPVEVSFSKHMPELIDTLLVLTRAGHSPAATMSQLYNLSPDELKTHLLRLRSELIAGQRFAEAMKNLRESLGPCFYSICDILICQSLRCLTNSLFMPIKSGEDCARLKQKNCRFECCFRLSVASSPLLCCWQWCRCSLTR